MSAIKVTLKLVTINAVTSLLLSCIVPELNYLLYLIWKKQEVVENSGERSIETCDNTILIKLQFSRPPINSHFCITV